MMTESGGLNSYNVTPLYLKVEEILYNYQCNPHRNNLVIKIDYVMGLPVLTTIHKILKSLLSYDITIVSIMSEVSLPLSLFYFHYSQSSSSTVDSSP